MKRILLWLLSLLLLLLSLGLIFFNKKIILIQAMQIKIHHFEDPKQ
jgi:hypothetical protein